MKRVMVCGAPGSGKSTLARQLGAATGLPVFHMDHIHHLPNWQPRPMKEKHAMASEIEAQDAWIFEGGMSSTYASRAARADTLIWLDLPIGLRLWRVTKRLFQHYGKRRPDMAEGCFETIGWHTWEFYVWIFQTRRSGRRALQELVNAQGDNLDIHHLRSRRALAGFLNDVEGAAFKS